MKITKDNLPKGELVQVKEVHSWATKFPEWIFESLDGQRSGVFGVSDGHCIFLTSSLSDQEATEADKIIRSISRPFAIGLQ